MTQIHRDWSDKLSYALQGYQTTVRTLIGATPFSLVYGFETVLQVEIEIKLLRVAIESGLPEAQWAQ